MICNSCKTEKLISDFINRENICYKCLYREKIKKTSKKQIKGPTLCRTCGKEVIHKKTEKKRQRTVFCSLRCAQKGHKLQVSNHWTRKIKIEGQ